MGKDRLYVLFIFFYLVSGSWYPASVYAEGIDMGMFRLYPAIKIEERYEDNIFQRPNDAKEDFITTTAPELLFKFKCTGKDVFDIDYKYKIQRLNKYTAGNKENNKFDVKLEAYGEEYFLKMNEDFEEFTATTSYAEYFDDYYINDALITAGGDFDKTSFEITYENLYYEYGMIDSINNYNKHIFDLTGYYKVFPKTKALLEYNFGKIGYEHDATKNGETHEFLTGITGELTQKTTGTIKTGYNSRDYQARADWKEPVTYGNILYEISKKTTLSATFERKAVESINTTENFYETRKIAAKLTQELTPKTTAYIDASYNHDKYPVITTAKRKDNIWDIKTGLDINTRKWFVSGISYEFKKRNSNESTNDYENNITLAYIKATY